MNLGDVGCRLRAVLTPEKLNRAGEQRDALGPRDAA